MEEIKVSIAMITYNHEPYIEQAVCSVLEQNMDFNWELIIGEDGSTDGTADIIKRICRENQSRDTGRDRILPVLREKNIGMTKNAMDVLVRCRGEYIAFLEGDDYWCDRNKLSMQAAFLDLHKDYSAYYHNARVINETGEVIFERKEGYCTREEYDLEQAEAFLLPGQTSTLMIRNYFKQQKPDIGLFQGIKHTPLDRLAPVLLLKYGRIYCDRETYSVYRYILKGNSSWSSRNELQKVYSYLNYYYNLTEIQSFASGLGMNLDLKEKKAFFYSEALYTGIFRGRPYCLPMCLKMLWNTEDRPGLLSRGNRLFMRKIKWKLINKFGL